MPTKTTKRSTLLRYWTLRYVITLCVGLLMIGVASVLWLQHAALTSRLQNIGNFSQEAADYITSDTGQIVIPAHLYEWIDLNQRKYKLPAQFGLTVFNQAGSALFYKSAPPEAGPPAREGAQPAPPRPSWGKPAPSSSRPDVPSGRASGSDPAFPTPPPLEDRVVVKKMGNQYTITSPVHGQNSVIGTIPFLIPRRS